MTRMTRGAALCGLMTLLTAAGCGDSPTRPSPQLPATFEMTGGQTVVVPGTNLRMTVVAPPTTCGPNELCLAWFGSRLEAQVGRGTVVELPIDLQPAQRQVGAYRVSIVEYLWGPARIAVAVERR